MCSSKNKIEMQKLCSTMISGSGQRFVTSCFMSYCICIGWLSHPFALQAFILLIDINTRRNIDKNGVCRDITPNFGCNVKNKLHYNPRRYASNSLKKIKKNKKNKRRRRRRRRYTSENKIIE